MYLDPYKYNTFSQKATTMRTSILVLLLAGCTTGTIPLLSTDTQEPQDDTASATDSDSAADDTTSVGDSDSDSGSDSGSDTADTEDTASVVWALSVTATADSTETPASIIAVENRIVVGDMTANQIDIYEPVEDSDEMAWVNYWVSTYDDAFGYGAFHYAPQDWSCWTAPTASGEAGRFACLTNGQIMSRTVYAADTASGARFNVVGDELGGLFGASCMPWGDVGTLCTAPGTSEELIMLLPTTMSSSIGVGAVTYARGTVCAEPGETPCGFHTAISAARAPEGSYASGDVAVSTPLGIVFATWTPTTGGGSWTRIGNVDLSRVTAIVNATTDPDADAAFYVVASNEIYHCVGAVCEDYTKGVYAIPVLDPDGGSHVLVVQENQILIDDAVVADDLSGCIVADSSDDGAVVACAGKSVVLTWSTTSGL